MTNQIWRPKRRHSYNLLCWELLFCIAIAAMLVTPLSALALVLVQNGQPRAVLVLPAHPSKLETQAAGEIQQYVKQISGTEMLSVSVGEDLHGLFPIRIGSAASNDLLKAVQAKGSDPASFILKVSDDVAAIRGLSDQGTLFGAYELLEQLGVRWFMPGKLGTVVPRQSTLQIKSQVNIQIPSFPARNMNAARKFPKWGLHMRMGGPWFPASHGIPPFQGSQAKKLFKEHPEYFALVDGKRSPRQLNIADPHVIKLTIKAVKAYFRKHPDAPWIGMGPNDGIGFSEGKACKALDGGDWDPFANHESMTDRYIWFFNQVLKGIHKEFPHKKIAFYIYSNYMRPPVRWHPNPNIVGALAPITLCRIHGPNNPICPEKGYYAWLVKAWSKQLSQVYDRGYWYNLSDPGFVFIMVDRLRKQIPLAYKLGVAGWRVETVANWATQNPSLYIAAKLMWNAHANVDALLKDYYQKFYGPAAKPMGEYTALMINALRDGDYHTGGSFDIPHFYSVALRKKASKLLGQAAQLVGSAEKDNLYAKRVGLTRKGFDYTQAFIRMIDQRNRGNFMAAEASLNRLKTIQKNLITGYAIPMLQKRAAKRYLKRFWSQATEQGYARVTGNNQLVAFLNDQWEFHLDPRGLGETLRWQRTGHMGGNWRPIRTSSESWSDQGFRYYKGLAWYRQTVVIPSKFKGQRIMLWFGGVDEKAKVWVNGKLVGTSPGRAFIPFEMDATDAVRFGKSNTVAVRIINDRLDELGTGGITAPVMFYAAGAKND